jgi:hypothetical protein
MTALRTIIDSAAGDDMAGFSRLVEAELRGRIRRAVDETRPTVFSKGARGDEAAFKLDHGLKVHPHPVATDDNFRSDLPSARRPADRATTGNEESADVTGVPSRLKQLALRGTGVNAQDPDIEDTSSMSAREFTDFVDDEEFHTETVQRVMRHHLGERDVGEYDRRIALRDLREAVETIAPHYVRQTGRRTSSPVLAEVARHLADRLERL